MVQVSGYTPPVLPMPEDIYNQPLKPQARVGFSGYEQDTFVNSRKPKKQTPWGWILGGTAAIGAAALLFFRGGAKTVVDTAKQAITGATTHAPAAEAQAAAETTISGAKAAVNAVEQAVSKEGSKSTAYKIIRAPFAGGYKLANGILYPVAKTLQGGSWLVQQITQLPSQPFRGLKVLFRNGAKESNIAYPVAKPLEGVFWLAEQITKAPSQPFRGLKVLFRNGAEDTAKNWKSVKAWHRAPKVSPEV